MIEMVNFDFFFSALVCIFSYSDVIAWKYIQLLETKNYLRIFEISVFVVNSEKEIIENLCIFDRKSNVLLRFENINSIIAM